MDYTNPGPGHRRCAGRSNRSGEFLNFLAQFRAANGLGQNPEIDARISHEVLRQAAKNPLTGYQASEDTQ